MQRWCSSRRQSRRLTIWVSLLDCLLVFLKEAVQKAHPDGVTGHIKLQCPVRSPTRRTSEQRKIDEQDAKSKGSLHHSEKLSSFELARRQLQKEGDQNEVRMTMMDRIAPGDAKEKGLATAPDSGSDKKQKIVALMAEAKQLREEWVRVKALPDTGAAAAPAEPW